MKARVEQASADLASNNATVQALEHTVSYWERERSRDSTLAGKGAIPGAQADATVDKATEARGILEPRIYRITDATKPLLTVALSPKPGSAKTLSELRLLAENQIEDQILTLPGIADVDVFGGHQPEVKVRVDRDRLAANRVSIGEVVSALAKQNVSAPAGAIYSYAHEYLVKTVGEFANLQQIRDKPMCKPATMGLILLGGTIVNNSILLLDFILNARKRGMTKDEAILQAVRLRIRPILMTTVSTIVGLTPLVFEMAVGLERMSPLGIVAAMGLMIGTFMTMVVIPVVYSSMDSLAGAFGWFWRFMLGRPQPSESAAAAD